jgi:hypothetical protein
MERAEKVSWQIKGEDIWRGKWEKRKNDDATFLSYL